MSLTGENPLLFLDIFLELEDEFLEFIISEVFFGEFWGQLSMAAIFFGPRVEVWTALKNPSFRKRSSI